MSPKLAAALDDDPLRNQSAELLVGESPRRNPTPAGAAVEHAMKIAKLEVKQLAAAMGVSDSVLLRGFKDQESISFQRLARAGELYPGFARWLLVVQAAARDDVRVRIGIEVEGEFV